MNCHCSDAADLVHAATGCQQCRCWLPLRHPQAPPPSPSLYCLYRLRTAPVLQDKGWEQMLGLVAFYKENAAILRRTFEEMGFEVYGGENAPYVWVGFPGGWVDGRVGGWVLVRRVGESASWVQQVSGLRCPITRPAARLCGLPACLPTSIPTHG